MNTYNLTKLRLGNEAPAPVRKRLWQNRQLRCILQGGGVIGQHGTLFRAECGRAGHICGFTGNQHGDIIRTLCD